MGSRGQRPMPAAVIKMRRGKMYKGQHAAAAIDNQPEPDVAKPQPPHKLTGDAAAIWKTLTPVLIKNGCYTEMDRHAWYLACLDFALAKAGDMRALDRWLKCHCRQFGLTPSDRTQISVSKKQAGPGSRDRSLDIAQKGKPKSNAG